MRPRTPCRRSARPSVSICFPAPVKPRLSGRVEKKGRTDGVEGNSGGSFQTVDVIPLVMANLELGEYEAYTTHPAAATMNSNTKKDTRNLAQPRMI